MTLDGRVHVTVGVLDSVFVEEPVEVGALEDSQSDDGVQDTTNQETEDHETRQDDEKETALSRPAPRPVTGQEGTGDEHGSRTDVEDKRMIVSRSLTPLIHAQETLSRVISHDRSPKPQAIPRVEVVWRAIRLRPIRWRPSLQTV